MTSDFNTPRRRLLQAGLAAGSFAALPVLRARAQGLPNDPRMSERSAGNADAKIVVEEWFSLTCTHCARFAREVFPDIRSKLIDTGKIRYIFRDYPLDQIALMAAQVARTLPAERYEPFILALFDSQSTWAFDRSRDPKEELAKLAALAGMPRATFDAAVADTTLRDGIIAVQSEAETRLKISSTPSFVVGGKVTPGEQTYDSFVKMVGL